MLYDKERLGRARRQAGRGAVREQRPDAAQLRGRRAGGARGGRRAAEAAATQPGALERHYVPGVEKGAGPSKLLQPRDAEKDRLHGPAKPASTLRLHLPRSLSADVRRPVRRGGSRRIPRRRSRATWPSTRCRWPTSCWNSTGRARSGIRDLGPRRSRPQRRPVVRQRPATYSRWRRCVSCHKFGGVGVEFGRTF